MTVSSETKTNHDQVIGSVMVIAAVLSVLVMAHHPTSADQSGLVRLVHGALMALIVVILCGFVRFADLLGRERVASLAGLVAYSVGALANLLAATINGFVVPALASRGVSGDIFAFSWELNQALAYEGVYAISAGFVFFGGALFARKSILCRLIGISGVMAGIGPALLLASGALEMHVAGALIVYSAEAMFSAIVGGLLISRRLL